MKPDQVKAKVTLKTYDVYTGQRRQPFLTLGSSVLEVIDYMSNIRVNSKLMSKVIMRENVQRFLNMKSLCSRGLKKT